MCDLIAQSRFLKNAKMLPPAAIVPGREMVSTIFVNMLRRRVPVSTIPFRKSELSTVWDRFCHAAWNCLVFRYYLARFVTPSQLLLYKIIITSHTFIWVSTISSPFPLCRVGAYLFNLREFHPRQLRLRLTPFDLGIRDFHSYFIIVITDIPKSRSGDSLWTFTLDLSTIWSMGYVRVIRCMNSRCYILAF